MTTTSEIRKSRLGVLLLTVVLLAAGCGDDGEPGEARPPADTDPSSPDPSGSGDGGASVSIGGESFELEHEVVCIALGGAVSGTFRNDEGVEVSIDVPPEDWETSTTGDWEAPSLTLRDERDEMNWRIFEAGPEVATTYAGAEDAVITDFSVDGSHATGNGLAIDTFAITRANAGGEPPSPVPVIFGFECG